MASNALRAFLEAPADDGRLMIDLADDEHGADDARDQALQDDGLVVVNGDGGAVAGERNSVGRGRRVICLRRRGRRFMHTRKLVHIDDVDHERVYKQKRV